MEKTKKVKNGEDKEGKDGSLEKQSNKQSTQQILSPK